jgi:uracil-DNA glycosylase
MKPSDVVVVILGQDPYHQPNQADGLAFSVPKEQPIPPSLKNIFKELVSDMSISRPSHGNLDHWASQGVLLLNSILTVKIGDPLAHQKIGWEKFTDEVIRKLGQQNQPIVFVLWGTYAQSKRRFIDEDKHLLLVAPHPSPLSSYRGFFGSQPFSKINAQLRQWGKNEIQW